MNTPKTVKPMLAPKRSGPLQIGFLPVTDCAPLIIARELGLFDKYELSVELRRETKWASIRDKVIYGELDAAQAPATLPFLANLGVDSDQCACVTGLVLNLQGNAITISRQLWEEGVRDAVTLRERIYQCWGKKTFTFGVVYPYSSQHFLLLKWLKTGGIVPNTEVRIVVIPPAQTFPTLKLGYVDGYCAGEPWTSVAVEAGAGVCVATSAELSPLHPEKVLMVRRDYAEARAGEHERLIAALLEACAFCDRRENHALVSEILSQPQYVNAPTECLRAGLDGSRGVGGTLIQGLTGMNIFHQHNANEPSDEKAAWVMGNLYGLMEQNILSGHYRGRVPVIKNIFRRDIFNRARAILAEQAARMDAEPGDMATAVSLNV